MEMNGGFAGGDPGLSTAPRHAGHAVRPASAERPAPDRRPEAGARVAAGNGVARPPVHGRRPLSRGPDAATLLARALDAGAAAAGCDLTVTGAEWARWASVTFTGARHTLSLAGSDGPAARDWLAGLAELELRVRGQVVADIAVDAVARADGRITARVEALTVEAA